MNFYSVTVCIFSALFNCEYRVVRTMSFVAANFMLIYMNVCQLWFSHTLSFNSRMQLNMRMVRVVGFEPTMISCM